MPACEITSLMVVWFGIMEREQSGPEGVVLRERSRLGVVRLFLLGGFRVERPDAVVPAEAWNQRSSPKELLKILALRSGHRIHRSELLELMWPDVDPASSVNRLAKALHVVRRVFEPDLRPGQPSAYITMQDEVIWLTPELVWVDVDAFQEAANAALAAGDRASYEAALAAYGGQLLPEDRYEDWAILRREALESLYLRVLQGYAELLERSGEPAQAIAAWQQVVEIDPLYEAAQRALMLLYASTGNRALAVRQYEQFRGVLRDELGEEPPPEIEEALRQVQEGQVARAAPPSPPSVPPEAERIASAIEPSLFPAVLPLPRGLSEHVSAPLVGRDHALAFLWDQQKCAADGEGRLVLVSGEAGVGKTRLVAELAREAAGAGALVLWGAGYGNEPPVPYGPFVDALEAYVRALSPAGQAELARKYPLLSRLLPSVVGSVAAPDEVGEGVHGRLFATVAAILSDLAAAVPLVLVLDDLHAADAASLQLLQYLARTVENHRWLLIGTYRDEEMRFGSVPQRMLSALLRQGIARQLDLHRLSSAEVTRLLHDRLPGGAVGKALAHRVYGLSLGNPLFAEELLAAMEDRGMLLLEEGEWVASPVSFSGVPARVQDLVAQRIAALGEDVLRVLSLAAVLGMEWPYDRLLAAASIAFSDFTPDMVLTAVDAGVAGHLVEERETVCAFRHPLFHAVLLHQLTLSRRRHYHGAIAAAIERQTPNDINALAYHFAQSHDVDRAIFYLRQAAENAGSLHAHVEVARYYGELAERLEERAQDVAALDARFRAALALISASRYDEARAILERVSAARSARGDLPGWVAATAEIGRLLFLQGRGEEGLARMQEVVQRVPLETLPEEVAARAYAVLASLHWSQGGYDEVFAICEQARGLDLVREGAHPLAIDLLVWRGVALLALEQVPEGMAVLRAVIPRAADADDLMAISRANNSLAEALQERGEFRAQMPYLERALGAAVTLGDPTRIAFMLYRRGWARWMLGDWEGAREDMQRARATAEENGPTSVTPYILHGLAAVAAGQGALDEALLHVSEARKLLESNGDNRVRWALDVLTAQIDLARGLPASALELLRSLHGHPGTSKADLAAMLALEAKALLALGSTEEARAVASRALEVADNLSGTSALVDALRTLALVEVAQEHWEEARTLIERALVEAAAIENPFVQARLRLVEAQVAKGLGDAALARLALEQALAVFESVGASREAGIAVAALQQG